MIPDKIYLSKLVMAGAEILDKPVSDSDVEYIRKEAILKWAKDEQAKCSSETHPYAMFMNVIIDKLNSL